MKSASYDSYTRQMLETLENHIMHLTLGEVLMS